MLPCVPAREACHLVLEPLGVLPSSPSASCSTFTVALLTHLSLVGAATAAAIIQLRSIHFKISCSTARASPATEARIGRRRVEARDSIPGVYHWTCNLSYRPFLGRSSL